MTPKQHARASRRYIEIRKTFASVSHALREALATRTATQADLDRVINAARNAFKMQAVVLKPVTEGGAT